MFVKTRILQLSFAVFFALASQKSFAFDITSYYPHDLMKAVNKTQSEIRFVNRNFDNQTAMEQFYKKINQKSYADNNTHTHHLFLTNIGNNSTTTMVNSTNETKNTSVQSNTTNATNSTNLTSKPMNTIITQKLVNFTNTTTVHGSLSFLENIKFLYNMGYLPFYPKEIKWNKVTWYWNVMLVPDQLASLTPQSSDNILYRGAVKAFLTQNGLNNHTDLYKLLMQTNKCGIVKNQKPFTWVLVNQKQPERLKVWQNGSWVAESNCNTGVMHLTPDGNFIIYARYRNFTMSGRWPIDGHYYHDPDVPYVNFFNGGDAIHGFRRYAYGYPQSAGCVELPVSKAKNIYSLLYIGTVVTIIN